MNQAGFTARVFSKEYEQVDKEKFEIG